MEQSARDDRVQTGPRSRVFRPSPSQSTLALLLAASKRTLRSPGWVAVAMVPVVLAGLSVQLGTLGLIEPPTVTRSLGEIWELGLVLAVAWTVAQADALAGLARVTGPLGRGLSVSALFASGVLLMAIPSWSLFRREAPATAGLEAIPTLLAAAAIALAASAGRRPGRAEAAAIAAWLASSAAPPNATSPLVAGLAISTAAGLFLAFR